MIVPEREKGVRSIRLPQTAFRALTFFSVCFCFFLGIMIYDYWKILDQVHENKHLTIENNQLKEQIQLNQMKINSLNDDLDRIKRFERKLRVITGLEKIELEKNGVDESNKLETDSVLEEGRQSNWSPESKDETYLRAAAPKRNQRFENEDNYSEDPKYVRLKELYEKKIAANFGLQSGYQLTKDWSLLTKNTFKLASRFAFFDWKIDGLRTELTNLELKVHELDQFLLDRISFLKSTPTLIPAKGWITSYYGPRISPTSGRLKMHEGIDIGANRGTPITAPADAIVVYAGKKPGFGNFVQLDHGYGIETAFAHAKKVLVKKGMKIKRGERIAAVGSTGYSTGPHVHYEVRVNGTPVDPLYFILDY